MKAVEKPRAAVILVRPKQGRSTQWEVACGDCGLVGATKSKGAGEKMASAHSKALHEGTAITKTRQA